MVNDKMCFAGIRNFIQVRNGKNGWVNKFYRNIFGKNIEVAETLKFRPGGQL